MRTVTATLGSLFVAAARRAHLRPGDLAAGLWASLGLGIVMTRDSSPDPKYLQSPTGACTAKATRTTSSLPFVGDRGQIGVMAGGMW